ncbi:MAG: chitobiase/beta-hexosaminidase C-terminal domain-containing protein [Planctomycetota bacterium]|jgi:hypothetical protein
MWRLHAAGELEGQERLMFKHPRPVEELYDTDSDPHEIRNLAREAEHAGTLLRMRAALDAWLDDVGDMGRTSESEMVRRWYPDGKQPQTAAPVFVPISEASPGREPSPEGGTFAAPCLLQLHSATQGASIAYALSAQDEGDKGDKGCQGDEGKRTRWKLYSSPLELPLGTTTVRARAIRIGYKESSESSATFTIQRAPGARRS